jgi:hypothetical protein
LLGENRRALAVALLLAFFYISPALALSDWLHQSPIMRFGTRVIGLEMFTGAYDPGGGTQLGIALMPFFLLAVERALDPTRRAPGRSSAWYGGWAALTGMLVAWLHPWQGMTLLVIVLALAIWGRGQRRYLGLALPALLTAAPLAYFFVLSHTKSSWMLASHANNYPHFGWWLFVSLLPLVIALPGYLGRAEDLQTRIVRIWPIAGFAVYLALDRTWFYHAFAGLSLPLAILAVRGWERLGLPRLMSVVTAAAVVVVVTVPGLVWYARQLYSTQSQHFFRPAEARALAFLNSSPRPGGVMAPVFPLGQAVPPFTGRQTYVGNYYWTPDYTTRATETEALFDGKLPRAQAAQLVRSSQARFLASDCKPSRHDLRPVLGRLIVGVRGFGCATVYEVQAG